jgi:hypothetical protein
MPFVPSGTANGSAVPPFAGFGMPNSVAMQAWQLHGLSPDAAKSIHD